MNILNPNYFLLPPSMNRNPKYITYNLDEPSSNSFVKECCSYSNSAEVVFSWTVGHNTRFRYINFFLLNARKRFLSAFASIVIFELRHKLAMLHIIFFSLKYFISVGFQRLTPKALSGEKFIISQTLLRS